MVIGTSELIVRPGLINVDFADVREIIANSGTALIGIGTGTGKTRAEDAAVGAIVSPLLEFPIDQAAGVIFNIVGGLDMSLTEVNAAASIIQRHVHPDANIIIGALVDERCGKQVSVTVLATGFGQEPSDVNANGGAAAAAAAARAEYAGAAAGARAEYANSGAAPAAPAEARAYGEGRRGGWTSNENSARMPQPHAAAPGRPSFEGRANNNGQDSPKDKKGVFRRMLNRWRD